MSKLEEKLFVEFPEVSTQQWEEVIQKDLKGADYDKKLRWKTDEHFTVNPYYRAENLENLDYLLNNPGEFPFVRGTKNAGNEWKIVQPVDDADFKKANKIALDSIEKGANAIVFNVKNIHSENDLSALLKNIELNKVSLYFEHAVSYSKFAELFLRYIKEHQIEKENIFGAFLFDPISDMLLHNKFQKSQEGDLSEIKALAQTIGNELPNFKYITVKGNIFHDCGATIDQELAFALSTANEYLSYALTNGISIDDIAPKIGFTFAVGSNYFMEIAKIRTARLLWATIVEAYQPSVVEAAKMHILSISSSWNKTIFDANVNMLRLTTEAMSAAIGGADAIMLMPYDQTYKTAEEFSCRIARNVQIILKEESYFDKVADPAAGSYYIENLTNSLAQEAWKIFLDTDKQGGIIAQGLNGEIKKQITASCAKKDLDIATRKKIILGTNQFPNLAENMSDKVEINTTESYDGLQPYRAAASFEALRLDTEKWAKINGVPKIFLLKIGNLSMRQARASFISNFFGCAGYEIIETQGYKTAAEGIKDAIKANPNMVVVCSSDEEYEIYASEVALAIKEYNPDIYCLVAGNPVEVIESLKHAGVDDFIHVRMNLLETLKKYNHLLGISE